MARIPRTRYGLPAALMIGGCLTFAACNPDVGNPVVPNASPLSLAATFSDDSAAAEAIGSSECGAEESGAMRNCARVAIYTTWIDGVRKWRAMAGTFWFTPDAWHHGTASLQATIRRGTLGIPSLPSLAFCSFPTSKDDCEADVFFDATCSDQYNQVLMSAQHVVLSLPEGRHWKAWTNSQSCAPQYVGDLPSGTPSGGGGGGSYQSCPPDYFYSMMTQGCEPVGGGGGGGGGGDPEYPTDDPPPDEGGGSGGGLSCPYEIYVFDEYWNLIYWEYVTCG